MQSSTQKLIMAVLLFAAWVGLIIAKAYNPALDTSEIIPWVQSALIGLGVYHATTKSPYQPPKDPPL